MKWLAPHVLRRFGYRDSLVVGGVLASLGYMTCAFFRPDWPVPLIFVVLSACGFFMSFQFTAYNTIAYDSITPQQLSSATSLYTTLQQLMLSLGICAGAAVLQVSMALHGRGAPAFGDFSAAFLVVTLVSLSATIWNLRFAADAGSELCGHTPRTWSLRQALNEIRGITP
jgi:MFS family permease